MLSCAQCATRSHLICSEYTSFSACRASRATAQVTSRSPLADQLHRLRPPQVPHLATLASVGCPPSLILECREIFATSLSALSSMNLMELLVQLESARTILRPGKPSPASSGIGEPLHPRVAAANFSSITARAVLLEESCSLSMVLSTRRRCLNGPRDSCSETGSHRCPSSQPSRPQARAGTSASANAVIQ